MLQSQLFTKITKEAPKDEASYNALALIRAGFIDKLSAGVYSYLPLGLRVLNNICRIVREEMDKIGGQEILMPVLTPKENWEQTGRWEDFDVLFRLAGADKKEYALGATHEEIITPLAKKFILSYRDLPFAPYQIQTKFRNELRAKSGILRGREFLMKDMYSFNSSQEELDGFYEKVKEAYFKIYQRCGLGGNTLLTYASGGAFSKYSHEFQTLCEAGEDIIYICDDCKIAINKEIINEQNQCPVCGKKEFREAKAIEVGNIFKLGTRFSESFKVEFTDKEGKPNLAVMGCYGFGPSRVMGTIVESCHDDKGIIWPEEIAPFKIHLILLGNKDSWLINKEKADKIYKDLQERGFEVLYDERENFGAGEKFAAADLIGCPLRLVLSDKTLKEDSVEFKRRDSQDAQLIKIDKLIDWLIK